jgi:hypothetical protein
LYTHNWIYECAGYNKPLSFLPPSHVHLSACLSCIICEDLTSLYYSFMHIINEKNFGMLQKILVNKYSATLPCVHFILLEI